MANALESQLHYPLADTLPAPGRSLEIAPGVRWLRMGLPFALDHINLWLLRDRQGGVEGWSIVDCGITNNDTRERWESVFAQELGDLPVLRVICTHMHPDHIGLAHWLVERWSVEGRTCRLWISATDWNAARMASRSTTGFGGDAAAAFFASHGLTDPAALGKVRARSNYYASMVPQVPASFHRLMDGLRLEAGGSAWTCIAGYGHAPEHIALFREAADGAPPLLISGDMVLPRISTNVSVMDIEPEGNPLQLYLDSLQRYLVLPADTLVLPSHGKPFTGLHERVQQLRAHHAERYADVLTACDSGPQTAAALLPVIFRRPLDLHQTTFAMGEAVAHLHALWFGGELAREQGADGIYRFTRTPAARRP